MNDSTKEYPVTNCDEKPTETIAAVVDDKVSDLLSFRDKIIEKYYKGYDPKILVLDSNQELAVVSLYRKNKGVAFVVVFLYLNGEWIFNDELETEALNNKYRCSIAIDNNSKNIFVGSVGNCCRVYSSKDGFYDECSIVPSPTKDVGNNFGYNACFSKDGFYLVITDFATNGKAYLYKRVSNNDFRYVESIEVVEKKPDELYFSDVFFLDNTNNKLCLVADNASHSIVYEFEYGDTGWVNTDIIEQTALTENDQE